MRELWLGILQTGGARIYGLVTGIITLSLTARWLGPEGRGEIAAIMTWIATFSTVAYLSLGQIAIHRASQSAGDDWLRGALSTLGVLAIILTILGWLIAFALYRQTDGVVFGDLPTTLLVIGFVLLPFNIWEKYGSSLLTAVDRLRIYNLYQVIGRTFTVLAIVLLIPFLGFGVGGVLIAYLAGQLVVAAGGIRFLVRKSGGLRMPTRYEISDFIAGGLKLHLNAIGAFLFTSADILMLNYYRGAEETGYYQLGVQLMGVMMALPQAASMVVYSKVTAKGADRAWPEHKRLLMQLMGLMVFGALAVGITAPWWLTWVAGSAFEPAVKVFQWQLLAVIGMAFSIMMSPQWIARGYFIQASLLTLLVGIANLAANAVLIPDYGMYGAIWASLGVYTFSIFGNGMMMIWCDMKSKNTMGMPRHG